MQDGPSKCNLTAFVTEACHDLGTLTATPQEGRLQGSALARDVSSQVSVLTAWA